VAIGERVHISSSAPFFSFRETPGMSSGTVAALVQRRFSEAPALLIDDIHLAPPDQTMKGALWQLFNDFHTLGKPIVITGLSTPKELANLDEHLASRLLWGLVARVDVSDDESRQMIMQKRAADRQVIIPSDVCEFLLKQLPRDLPTLIVTLDRIIRYSLSTGKKVSPRLAAEVISGKGVLP